MNEPEFDFTPPDTGNWQDRLVEERAELLHRLTKLELFMTTDHYQLLAAQDISLLGAQRKVMENYLDILNRRIERLSIAEEVYGKVIDELGL